MQLSQVPYNIEIDNMSKKKWMSILGLFEDATIWQTWSYGIARFKDKRMTHIVLSYKNQVIAAAQGYVIQMPFLKSGIVHFSYAPMWKLKNHPLDYNNLQSIIEGIWKEYVKKRGLLVRIRSCEIGTEGDRIPSYHYFQSYGFLHTPSPHYQTMRMDLSKSLGEIKKSFSTSWRRHLNASERKGFTIKEGSDIQMFDQFVSLFHEMHQRKKLFDYNPDIPSYRFVQQDLPQKSKMIVMICEHENEPVAASLVCGFGNTGMYLLGCTSNRAIKENLRASYLLHWKTINALKTRGYHWYDLRGYDEKKYPGVSRFKRGMRGDIVGFSEFSGGENTLSTFTVGMGDRMLHFIRSAAVIKRRIKYFAK